MPTRLRAHRIVLLATALAVGAVVPAGAQDATTPTASERAERDDAAARRSEVEAELGLLRRSDVELSAELSRLDAEIADLEARAAAADDELADLQARLVVLREDLVVAEQQAAEQQERMVERAVAAYIDPRPQLGMALLADATLEDVGRRKVLLDAVADRDRAVLDDHLAAEAELRGVRGEAEEAEARVAELKAGTERDLVTMRDTRARQAAVAAELDDRIADFQAEADSLAAEESRLTAMLAARQAEVAARRTTTTTAAPTTTTTAAPTTTARPGTSAPGASSTVAPTTSTTRPTTTTTTTTGGSLLWPTNGVLTSTFGMRWGRMHRGIDIGASEGTPIYAAAGGTVFFAGPYGDYGNLTLVDHGDGMVTAYAHQSGFAVTSGSVSRGQTIGYVGNTGHSTGPHLHFEVRIGGTAVDPMGYLG